MLPSELTLNARPCAQ